MALKWIALAVTVLAATSAVIEAAVERRVFVASTQPDDERLRVVHDVDHPVTFTPRFADRAAWQRRADQIRLQVLVAEGLWPLPEKAPLDPVIHGKIDRGQYTIEKVFFRSYPGHYVSGSLFRPKGREGKVPAVLCPHGHWTNGRFYERSDAEAQKQIDEGAETTMQGAKFPIQARCHMLARMGCVVLLYDMVGYADSTAIDHRTGFTDVESVLRLQSFMGLQTWNSIRALDFVESLPEVDPKRIAVTGASGGATQTIILDAVDGRPAVAFPAVMVSESMQGGCVCENAPLLRVGTNNVEMAAVFAPKPLGMTAADDWTAELETDGLPKLKSIYALFGAKKFVTGKHFSFEHNYNQVSRELMYNWMNEHLKLGLPSPVKEEPFQPVPPGELSVYDEGHPRPADTADARALRQFMTESSDRQLDELWNKDPREYRRVVRTALRVMIHDQPPGPGAVAVRYASGPRVQDGAVVESGALGRDGAGEAVPFVSLVPQAWNGRVVVWVQPSGKSSLFDDAGKPVPEVRKLLDRQIAVICADLYQTGETVAPGTQSAADFGYAKQKYAGFYFAYNRGAFANQVHDLLTEIAYVRGWNGCSAVDVVASSRSGSVALAAAACSDERLHKCAADVGGFDFSQVREPSDPMLLPGALKYGGIYGLLPVCNARETLIGSAPKVAGRERFVPGGVEIRRIGTEALSTADLVEWILKPD